MIQEETLYNDDQSAGTIQLEREEGLTNVFITSREEYKSSSTEEMFLDEDLGEGIFTRWHLLEVFDDGLVNIYPFKNWNVTFFTAKYPLLSKITIEGIRFESINHPEELTEMTSSFPKAFVKTYHYGLGLKKEYAGFIKQLEEMKIRHLVISKTGQTKIGEKESRCVIKWSEFEEIRRSIDRVTKHAQSVSNIVKANASYNTLSFFLKDEKYPQKLLSLEDDSFISKMMSKASPVIASGVSRAEKREALDFVAANALSVLKQEPQKLIKLRNDIELVTLEELISYFEKHLNEGSNEASWQKMFDDNPFILNMAFGYPIVKLHGQASVGGRKFSGDGDKITDFLVKNNLSNNLALFEIKKPSAKLLSKTQYRSGVLSPSVELTGAVVQILDQKEHLLRNILSLKDASKSYNLETFSVVGILIIGKMPVSFDEQKSFELYRGNSKDVLIITFDELLEKLKQLHHFLRQA